MTGQLRKVAVELRRFSLRLPGAYEDFPWGESVAKVNKKVFVFLGKYEDSKGALSFSVKLPDSAELALALPFTEPTGYGLGKGGWVTARFKPGERPPLDLLLGWIEESYRSIAPKSLVAQLETRPHDPGPIREKPKSRKRRSP